MNTTRGYLKLFGKYAINTQRQCGKRSYMSVGVPMQWREQKKHFVDYYFCCVDLGGVNIKKWFIQTRLEEFYHIQYLFQDSVLLINHHFKKSVVKGLAIVMSKEELRAKTCYPRRIERFNKGSCTTQRICRDVGF